jgi:hypothetical protein
MDADWKRRHDDAAAKLTEDEYDAISGKSFRLGEVAAAESVPGLIRSKAGALFASGKDDLARWARDLATEMEQTAEASRARYHRDYGTAGR